MAFSTAAGVVGLSRIESVVTGSVGTDTVSLPTTPTNLIIAPATYYVLISGSPGSGTIGEHTITDPGPNYTITINGFNSSNVLVGTTTTNVNVNPGQVESVFLTLQP